METKTKSSVDKLKEEIKKRQRYYSTVHSMEAQARQVLGVHSYELPDEKDKEAFAKKALTMLGV